MLRTFLREREFLFLAAATVLFFYAPLFGGKTFFFRDLYMFYYPQHLHLVQMIRAGEWPLWDEFLHGGMPFLGEVANLVFYPTTFLYLILPVLTAFNIEIVLHIMLAALATYVLARQLGLSRSASFLAGGVYAYCGYSLSCVNLYLRMLALPLVPLLWLFWHLFFTEQKRRWFVASVLITAAFVLTGAIENLGLALLFVLFWSLLNPYRVSASRRLAFWFLLCGLGAGLALIQIFPSLETATQSLRAGGYRYQVFSAWSLHPFRIPEMVFPGFFGYTDRLRAEDYWGIGLEHYAPYILSVYFGLGVLVLAIRGIGANVSGIFSRKIRLYLLLFASACFIFSFGYHLSLFPLIYKIPLIRSFRYPLKVVAGSTLPIALLAGLGLQRDFSSDLSLRKSTLLIFWIIALTLAVFSLLLSRPVIANSFVERYFDMSSNIAAKGVYQAVLRATAVWWIVLLIYQSRRLSPRSWQGSFLAAILFIDLLWAGATVNKYAPREFFTDPPPIASLVRDHLSGGRFFRFPDGPNVHYFFPANDIVYGDRWNLETLENYSGTLYNIPLIFHEDYDGLAPKKIAQLSDLVTNGSPAQQKNIHAVSGVSLILSSQKLALEGLQGIAVLHVRNNAPFYVYRLNDFHGRAWFVSRIRSVPDSSHALKELVNPEFHSQTEAILEQPQHALQKECITSANVRELHRSAMHASYEVNSSCEGYVVFSDVYYPGWRYTIDDRPAQAEHANYAFTAIFVAPGKHIVHRDYWPASFTWGIAGSLFTTILLVLLIHSNLLANDALIEGRAPSAVLQEG